MGEVSGHPGAGEHPPAAVQLNTAEEAIDRAGQAGLSPGSIQARLASEIQRLQLDPLSQEKDLVERALADTRGMGASPCPGARKGKKGTHCP